MRTKLLGDLPVHDSGLNRGRLNRNVAAVARGLSQKELHKAYNNWIQIFRIEGSNLKFDEYLDKLLEAGITPNCLGNGLNKYHLSRYDDEGPYTINSCRFITKAENMQEQITNGKNYWYSKHRER